MKFQSPKGTRDYFPKEMAWRNRLIDAWRAVSIRNGFEQVDGPIFEPLDLYKVKSGDGIVSELFHFQDRGERELAIRPEFTPTLARMVAAQANALPKPVKWFCTPNLCRAERPQRGRQREFWQWNIDILGTEPRTAPLADAECIFTAVDLLMELGLTREQVRVKISHRQTVRHILSRIGVADEKMLEAFDLLDRRDKMGEAEFNAAAGKLGLDEIRVQRFEETCRRKYPAGDLDHMKRSIGMNDQLAELEALDKELRGFGIADWCEYDLGIVRGLAYYTGTVFELHETSGAMRAMAGGGRYDQLIELFGGPSMPAVGFGMGDVVLTDVLLDKGLLPEELLARPDVFVIAMTDAAAERVPSIVAKLRRQGVHARFSYKVTRNLGKLLKDADAVRARQALILDDKLEAGTVELKDLASGEQKEIALRDLAATLRKAQ
jgi:histidyl-tRNA synthetase